MDFLEVVNKITQINTPGPTPSFSEVHVLKAIESIAKSGIIGRKRLSKELLLGEGSTRTLPKHLRNTGLVQSSRKGISLTNFGNEVFSDIRKKISESIDIPKSPITIGLYNVAILVKNLSTLVGSGMEQRDAAIKIGATGATTLIYSKNKLFLPINEEDLNERFPNLHNKLVTQLNPKENDVIIVGSGSNRFLAEIGAKVAAINLLRK